MFIANTAGKVTAVLDKESWYNTFFWEYCVKEELYKCSRGNTAWGILKSSELQHMLHTPKSRCKRVIYLPLIYHYIFHQSFHNSGKIRLYSVFIDIWDNVSIMKEPNGAVSGLLLIKFTSNGHQQLMRRCRCSLFTKSLQT